MKRRGFLDILPVIFAIIVFPVLFDSDVCCDTPNITIMPYDDVQPGMSGIGLSVFQGYTIEEFPVEIIGKVPNIGPDKNLILARVGSELIEKSGVMSGISGSPVYVDGKLIGALSSSWSFSKEPIAGITPIEQMLSILERKRPEARISRFLFEEHPEGTMCFTDVQQILNEAYGVHGSKDPAQQMFRNISFPLSISGSTDNTFSLMKELFQPLGFQLTVGGRVTADKYSTYGSNNSIGDQVMTIKPGSAVGIDLISGDMTISSVGTATYINGDTILAFGHPMFNLGPSAMPLVKAYVHAIIPSTAMSFKFASTTQTIGTVIQDRQDGVLATLGEAPPMLPLSVSVINNSDKITHRFSYNLIRDPFFTPTLAYFALLNTLDSSVRSIGSSSMRIISNLKLKNRDLISLENTYSSMYAVQEASRELLTLFSILSNPFEEVYAEDVSFEIIYSDSIERVLLHEIRLAKTVYRPGENIVVALTLQPYQETDIERELTITIPEAWSPGRYTLTVASQQWYQRNKMIFAPYRFKPRSMDQLIEILTKEQDQSQIYVTISHFEPGVTLRGRDYNNVPASLLTVLQPSPQSGSGGPSNQHIVYKSALETDAVVEGFASVFFNIKKD